MAAVLVPDPRLPNRQATNEEIEKETLLMVDYFLFARHPLRNRA
jgi:hypothetical protein